MMVLRLSSDDSILLTLNFSLLLLTTTTTPYALQKVSRKKVMKLSFSPLFNSSVSLLHQGCLPSYHLQSRRRMKRLTQFQSHLHSQWALHSEMHLRGHPNIHIVEGQSTCWCSSFKSTIEFYARVSYIRVIILVISLTYNRNVRKEKLLKHIKGNSRTGHHVPFLFSNFETRIFLLRYLD